MELVILNAGVVEVLKRLLGLEGAKVNLLAILAGVGLVAVTSYLNNVPMDTAIVPGVVTGLSSTGGYELAKRIARAVLDSALGE